MAWYWRMYYRRLDLQWRKQYRTVPLRLRLDGLVRRYLWGQWGGEPIELELLLICWNNLFADIYVNWVNPTLVDREQTYQQNS